MDVSWHPLVANAIAFAIVMVVASCHLVEGPTYIVSGWRSTPFSPLAQFANSLLTRLAGLRERPTECRGAVTLKSHRTSQDAIKAWRGRAGCAETLDHRTARRVEVNGFAAESGISVNGKGELIGDGERGGTVEDTRRKVRKCAGG
jgi:hypothetical protein